MSACASYIRARARWPTPSRRSGCPRWAVRPCRCANCARPEPRSPRACRLWPPGACVACCSVRPRRLTCCCLPPPTTALGPTCESGAPPRCWPWNWWPVSRSSPRWCVRAAACGPAGSHGLSLPPPVRSRPCAAECPPSAAPSPKTRLPPPRRAPSSIASLPPPWTPSPVRSPPMTRPLPRSLACGAASRLLPAQPGWSPCRRTV